MAAEEDIKPSIPSDHDISDKHSLTVPPAGISKLRHSRYEDVWPEDVHTAFMEAVALYPPMGKRRLKYYRLSTCENEHTSGANRPRSFGRCQLIQSYILEKTGKNRSRKQVSSHLQRLKKIYKNNPTMQPFFSERPQPSSDHHSASEVIASQDCPTISVSPSRLKSDLDLPVFQKANSDTPGPSTYPFTSEALSSISPNGSPCHAPNLSANFHDRLGSSFSSQQFLSPIPQQFPAVTPYLPCDNDCLSELHDPSLLKDEGNEGTRSGFSTPGFSTSLRRFTSKLPVQARLVDLGPPMHFSRATHSLGFQTAPQWPSNDGLMNDVYHNSQLTSTQEAFYTPYLPLQLVPSERQRHYPDLAASEWLWPKNPDLSPDPRGGSFTELCLRCPSMMHYYNSTLAHSELRDSISPPEGEISRFPRRISYSYALTSPATSEPSRFPRQISCSYVAPSPAAVSDNMLNESAIALSKRSPGSSEDFASPFVICPTPVYPVSYIHPDIHSNKPSDSFTPALGLPL